MDKLLVLVNKFSCMVKLVNVFLLFLLVLFSLTPGTMAEEADTGRGKQWLKDHFTIENRATFRYRSAGSDEDADFYDHWYVRGSSLFQGKFDCYFSGRVHNDLNGRSKSFGSDLFTSVEDRGSDWNEQVYQLYGDVHDQERRFGLRIGRQYIEDADSLHIDGALIRLFELQRISLGIFAGRPVSYYSGTGDDWTGGGSITGRPWWGNRSRLTYVHYKDDGANQQDDFFSLDVWQRLNEQFRGHGRVSMLDGDFYAGTLDFRYYRPAGNFDAHAAVSYWDGLTRQSREYSPLFSLLGGLDAYTYVTAGFSWTVLPWLSVVPSASGRFVDNDTNTQNREYGHYIMSFIFTPIQYWTVTASGEYWDVNSGDQFWGISGEVKYKSPNDWYVAVGSSYFDYEYLMITGNDISYSLSFSDVSVNPDGTATKISPDVYSFYIRGKYKINDYFSVRIKGEMEDNSVESDEIYRLRATLVMRYW